MNELGIGARVAGYRIEEVLGRGGMGVVYRAVDDRLGRSAALKVIAPGQAGDAAFRRRFIEESRAAAAIDHPNVLPVYEAGEEDGVLFLVSRMVEGADLSALLGRDGEMEVSRALALAGQIGAALDAAHARGLIHRDVKPANVLVARDPGPGTEHCYLTDFGLAQQGDRRTRSDNDRAVRRHPRLHRPRADPGGTVDGRADIYALAALFYECATGSPPFVRDSQPALLFAHLSDTPPPISGQVEGAPAALDGVIERAMAKAPEERFATCTEFIEAARAALGGTAPDRAGAGPPRAAETVVAGKGQAKVETVPGAPAPAGASDPTVGGGRGAPAPRRPAGGSGRRRGLALLGGGLAVLAVIGVLAWVLLGTGGGGSGGSGGSTEALRLSTETISLAREIGNDTGRLAESVESGGPTSDLVGAFEGSGRDAAELSDRANGDLQAGDPGRGDLRRSAGNLEEASAQLTAVAAGPGAFGARQKARDGKGAMNRALTGLDRALAALRRRFSDEGAAEAAESVEGSLTQLRDSRRHLVVPFDTLIRDL